ncbi:MAG: hypothetical protein WA642_08945 [Steroidobacteraceae bacterium]
MGLANASCPYWRRRRFAGKDKLTVFAVSFQENPEAAKMLKKLAVEWQINLIEDRNGGIASRYAITSIPHLFFIDRYRLQASRR